MNYLVTRNNASNDFDTFFDGMFGDWGLRNSRIPSVDVQENDKAFTIEAELPGYDEEEVKVHIEKHVLHISSEKTSEKENKKYLVRERSFSKFDRSFSLPEGIDENAIEGEFKNGILTITLPKLPVEQPKKIEIKLKK